MWASSDVRCRFLEHFFLALSCFGSGGAGLASPGRSASASVPEPCSSRHAAWLHFADFCSSCNLYCVSHPVFHNSLWHRRLACTVVAVSCLAFWRFWETIRAILFYRWLSWGRTIVCPWLMLSFFTKFAAGQCLMMYIWWRILMYGNTREWVICIQSKIKIFTKIEFFRSFSLKNNDYV